MSRSPSHEAGGRSDLRAWCLRASWKPKTAKLTVFRAATGFVTCLIGVAVLCKS